MSLVPFHTPKLSATAETVKVAQWLKQPGDAVREGEPFVELETDKTVLEVEAPVDGVLSAVHAQAGDDIDAGALLAEFEERKAETTRATSAAPATPRPAAAGAPVPAPMSPMRLAIANTVTTSRREIPTFWVERWVSTERIHALRERSAGQRKRPSLTDYFVMAIARALGRCDPVRTLWVEAPGAQPRLERLDSNNVGLIVALDDGMLIPVLTGCDTAAPDDVRSAREAAVEAARSGRVSGAMSGQAAVSLSNLGPTGVDRFEAIVQPGQTAIVAIGREIQRPQVSAGAVTAARGVHVVVSVDHRVVDGVAAGRFVSLIADWIEEDGAHAK